MAVRWPNMPANRECRRSPSCSSQRIMPITA